MKLRASSVLADLGRILVTSLAVLFAVARVEAQAGPTLFQDGDRWSALGDSITHSGTYHEWITLYHITRFPGRTIETFNNGISGDRAGGALQRLSWDVLPSQPTVVSVMFGMNDVERRLYSENPVTPEITAARAAALERYRENMRKLVAELQARDKRVILLTPSIFDQTAELERPKQTGVDDALAECAKFLVELGRETGTAVVDLHGPMGLLNRQRQAQDKRFTVVGPDRVHPGVPGHLLMAYLFLKAQQAPAEVSTLGIDLTTGRFAQKNGTVSNIVPSASQVTFTWAENALPFPVDPAAAPALEWVPFTSELNQQLLQVIGLRSGRWELRIDEERVGAFTAEEFAQGINLAMLSNTPQMRQAFDVLKLVNERASLVADSLRSVAQVEHQTAPEIGRPVTIAQMRPLVQQRIEALGNDPAAQNNVRMLQRYAERKAREVEAIGAADRMARLARLVAQPRPHVYLLQRER